MTRKITLIMFLLLLIGICLLIIFGTQGFITEKFETASELKQSNNELQKNYAALEKAVSQDMPSKKKILSSTIEQYQSTKKEYDELIAQYSIYNLAQNGSLEQGKEGYDIDFLWTIIGNYAIEEGINLKFDLVKNSQSTASTDSENLVVRDLKFSVTGTYIHLTDFIYDIEDDDRLAFEINDFNLEVNSGANNTEISETEPLNATFVVYGVKINSKNLIEKYEITNDDLSSTENNNTSDTTNTTNTSNTTNVTNTTNTTNTSSSNSTLTTN